MLWLVLLGCAPQPPDIALGPRPADTTSDLVVTPGPVEGERFTYRWAVDGRVQDDLRSNRVPSSRTARGERWTVAVARERAGGPSGTSSASLRVQNAPPTVLAQIVAGTDGLVAVLWPTDPDGDAVETTWSWEHTGDGRTLDGGVVPRSELSSGDVWRLTASATDGTDWGLPTEVLFEVGNQPPMVSRVLITPSAPTAFDVLTIDVIGSDPDGDPLEPIVIWRRDGTPIHEGPELPTGFLSVGQAIDAEVRVTDGTVTSEPRYAPPVIVRNSPPSIDEARVQPPILSAGIAPQCLVTGWVDPDGEPETLAIRWYLNGIAYDGPGPSPSSSELHKGDEVECEATPVDGESAGASKLSNLAPVVNTPPVLARVRFEPEFPTASQPIEAIVETPYDADGDPIVVDLVWLLDGVLVKEGAIGEGAGPLDARLSVPVGRGMEIEVRASPFDGEAYGIDVFAAVTIENALPVVQGLSFSPDPPVAGTDISAVFSTTDDDGDPVTTNIRWRVDGGAPIEVDRLPAAAFAAGQTITLEVIANDGIDYGDLASAEAIAQ